MYARKLVKTESLPKNISILGPVEAPIFLLRGKFRFRLLIKGNNRNILNQYTKFLLKKCPLPPSLRLAIDVDPYSFM